MLTIKKLFSKNYYRRKYYAVLKIVAPKHLIWVLTKERYKSITGKSLRYQRPADINEKLAWLTRYWQHPLKTKCADKYAVRQYITEQGLGHLLIPLLGVYSSSREICFDVLPDKFVLKCNHGSGYNVICQDKSTLDIDATKKQIDEWMQTDFSRIAYEIHYKDIPRKIVCEQMISETAPMEYQFWCINGEPESILVCRKNFDHTYDAWSYSLKWEHLCDRLGEEKNAGVERPVALEKMIEYARILSRSFPFVRVDFYEVKGRVYFAELTFTPSSNILFAYKDSFHSRLGKKLILPEKYIQ